MNPHYLRGQLLQDQGRHSDAERELRLALMAAPDDARAMSLLAACLGDQGKHDEAVATAQQACGLAPDDALAHYMRARALLLAGRSRDARDAAAEAIRLAPEDDDCHTLKASAHLDCGEKEEALAAAEEALALNAENTGAANLRAMALVRLGRKQEAAGTVAYALEREPENHLSHANQGWNELHLNNPGKAKEHFAEALRLNPDFEYARQGMLEALKAANPVYRGMLAYFLWMGRQSARMQWAFVFVTLFAQRALRALAQSSPVLGAILVPVLVLFYVFIYLSWVASPMFNLLLRFNRFGRLVLSADERRGSNWFGAAFFAALGATAAMLCGWDPGLVLALVCVVASVCVAAVFSARKRTRTILACVSAALFAYGIGGWALIFFTKMQVNAFGYGLSFMLAFVGFQFLSMILTGRDENS